MVLFGSLLDCLLLACGDTTLPSEEFTKLIDEAREHMGHMRKDYLQAVAEKDFLSEWETGMISPIPLIPSGLVRSARFDGKRSPKVTVDKPEIDE
jgi:hypothetical protein